ncbi:MAG: response regulator transcription factor [Oribacterium sp.]|nr:response regulator transcription factor [Oribacterium sp.]
MEKALNVLVVDDEKMITEAVSAYLKKMGCTVFCAESGTEALEIFGNNNIDFIILDLMLPGISGEEVCRRIREKSSVPVIMLTAKTHEDSILNGFETGADDYVTKPFSIKQLYARMEAIMRRVSHKRGTPENVLSYDGGLEIDIGHSTVHKNDLIINLTKSEWKILSSMVKHPQKIYTREELLTIVFGDDTDSLDRVIDTHIKNLRKKIEDDSRNPVYIRTVHGLGYKFGGELLNEKNTP